MAVLAQFLTVSRVPWLLLVMEVVYVFMIVRAEEPAFDQIDQCTCGPDWHADPRGILFLCQT